MNELELLLSSKKTSLPPHLLSTSLISLGDLGRKEIRHLPGDAGTSLSFEMGRDYLKKFGVDYKLVAGNHDLEGMDEFDTDSEVRIITERKSCDEH